VAAKGDTLANERLKELLRGFYRSDVISGKRKVNRNNLSPLIEELIESLAQKLRHSGGRRQQQQQATRACARCMTHDLLQLCRTTDKLFRGDSAKNAVPFHELISANH
jgi:hypothetical protein